MQFKKIIYFLCFVVFETSWKGSKQFSELVKLCSLSTVGQKSWFSFLGRSGTSISPPTWHPIGMPSAGDLSPPVPVGEIGSGDLTGVCCSKRVSVAQVFGDDNLQQVKHLPSFLDTLSFNDVYCCFPHASKT